MPLTDARDNFSRLVSDIESSNEGMYVLTKGGKPAIALINIEYLEKIMAGRVSAPLKDIEPKRPEFKPEPIKVSSPPPPTPVVLPQVDEKPLEPKLKPPILEPKPVSTTTTDGPDRGIDPSWTGKVTPPPTIPATNSVLPNNNPPKPTINPWPILPPKPPLSSQAPVSTPLPETPKPITQVPTPPLSPTPSTPTSPPLSPPPTTPTPSAPPPGEPPINVTAVPFSSQAVNPGSSPVVKAPLSVESSEDEVKLDLDLSAQTENKVVPSTGINFDTPPQIVPEPGELTPPPAPAVPAEELKPNPNPPTNAPASAQDIEI